MAGCGRASSAALRHISADDGRAKRAVGYQVEQAVEATKQREQAEKARKRRRRSFSRDGRQKSGPILPIC